jgi:hypothetical protein
MCQAGEKMPWLCLETMVVAVCNVREELGKNQHRLGDDGIFPGYTVVLHGGSTRSVWYALLVMCDEALVR